MSPDRVFPFMRNGGIKPAITPVSRTLTAYPIIGGSQALIAAGVTAFTATNANPFPVWLRGWAGAVGNMPDPTDDGNYIPPGAQITQSSSRPDYLVCTPDVSSLLWPYFAADGVTPLYDMSKAKCIVTFGSGL